MFLRNVVQAFNWMRLQNPKILVVILSMLCAVQATFIEWKRKFVKASKSCKSLCNAVQWIFQGSFMQKKKKKVQTPFNLNFLSRMFVFFNFEQLTSLFGTFLIKRHLRSGFFSPHRSQTEKSEEWPSVYYNLHTRNNAPLPTDRHTASSTWCTLVRDAR